MPTSRTVEPHTAEELLEAASQLSLGELERFVPELIALRARQAAPLLGARESELLVEVGRGLPKAIRQEYLQLVEKRDARTLSLAEHAELIRLSDEVEAYQVRRLELLSEVAQLRGVTLDRVLLDLGFTSTSKV